MLSTATMKEKASWNGKVRIVCSVVRAVRAVRGSVHAKVDHFLSPLRPRSLQRLDVSEQHDSEGIPPLGERARRSESVRISFAVVQYQHQGSFGSYAAHDCCADGV